MAINETEIETTCILLQVHYHKLLKKAVTDKQGEEALRYYLELDKTGKMMNVTDSSSLIELLVKEGPRVREAADIAEVITNTGFPIPSFIEVFRISFREFPRLVGRSCS